MKKFTVKTLKGGLNYPDLELQGMASLVRMIMMDKKPGETVTFTITVQKK